MALSQSRFDHICAASFQKAGTLHPAEELCILLVDDHGRMLEFRLAGCERVQGGGR